MHDYIWRLNPRKRRQAANFFTKLSKNRSWPHVSGVGQKIWVLGVLWLLNSPVDATSAIRVLLIINEHGSGYALLLLH